MVERTNHSCTRYLDLGIVYDRAVVATAEHVAPNGAARDFHVGIAMDETCLGIDLVHYFWKFNWVEPFQVGDGILAKAAAEHIAVAVSMIGDYPLV